ncbi:hypothetical protein AURDEDRAFT_127111 [Auricularia subglabra TFB-10046 SS5]|uniref:Uncharacterized protein n=1 Tax=Auricularia subglabra (strain TFB-10046 / SS5) TaxID=717982 RepID=J0DDA2_AURST|nr:hypothetical protein AURDEDRAFT_127111 [Auricularia subglabra TFB-10046 SS5]
MSYQPLVTDPAPPGVPARYWYPVNDPSAPRVGWFVDDGTCHGALTDGDNANVFAGEQFAFEDGVSERASSDEEDMVIPKLPVGSHTHALSYQPTATDPAQIGVPAKFWYPVDNPSAPRVGWFVDDGTYHGALTGAADGDVFDEGQFASDDGASAYASSDGEDAMTPELPMGSPARLAPKEALPTLATLIDKSNIIAVAPAAANKMQAPVSGKDSNGGDDHRRARARPAHGDENVPEARPAGHMSGTAIPSLWNRFRTSLSPGNQHDEDLAEATQCEKLFDAPANADATSDGGRAIDGEVAVKAHPMSLFTSPPPMTQGPREEPDRIVNSTFPAADEPVEMSDEEDNGYHSVRGPLKRYLGYANSY